MHDWKIVKEENISPDERTTSFDSPMSFWIDSHARGVEQGFILLTLECKKCDKKSHTTIHKQLSAEEEQ